MGAVAVRRGLSLLFAPQRIRVRAISADRRGLLRQRTHETLEIVKSLKNIESKMAARARQRCASSGIRGPIMNKIELERTLDALNRRVTPLYRGPGAKGSTTGAWAKLATWPRLAIEERSFKGPVINRAGIPIRRIETSGCPSNDLD